MTRHTARTRRIKPLLTILLTGPFLTRPLPGRTQAAISGPRTVADSSVLTPVHTPDGGALVREVHFRASASRVFAMLGRLTGVNIIVPEAIQTVVNVNLSSVPLERALRIVAASAGVAYRRVGSDYVVAAPERMAAVLEQMGTEERVALHVLTPEAAATALKQAVPFLTARPFGRSLLLIGANEDLEKAHALLRETDVAFATQPVQSLSLPLTFLPADDALALLSGQFSTLKAQKIGSGLALSGPPEELERARLLLQSLDQRAAPNVHYQVYQIKYSSARALAVTLRSVARDVIVTPGPEPYHIPNTAINLSTTSTLGNGSSSGGGGFGSGSVGGGDTTGSGLGSNDSTNGGGSGNLNGGNSVGTNFNNSDRARTLILSGSEPAIRAALALLDTLDKPTAQIVLDVKVVSTNPQTTENLGIDWSNGGQGQNFSLGTTFVESGLSGLPLFQGNVIRQPLTGGQFGRLPIQFSATLNAFFRRDDVKIVAKPQITTLDNETGTVFVGETRRISVSSLVNNAGTNNVVLNNVVEIPVGIILQMRPRVNADDLITLHVHPIVSSGGATDARTGLFSTFQREADTYVRIRSGETLVIGGLLQDEDTRAEFKIPFLGDIPLFGQFFRSKSRTHLLREVLVFVTPTLLHDGT